MLSEGSVLVKDMRTDAGSDAEDHSDDVEGAAYSVVGQNEKDAKRQHNADRSLKPKRPPAWAWGALIIAVVACSSGGVWFALLDETPAMLRASWRLTITAVLQAPGWVRDLAKADPAMRERYAGSFLWLLLAGVALAVHFCAWSLSLNMTSLSHSLLFVCTTPILLVTFHGLAWLACHSCRPQKYPHPPTWLECLGTLVGFGAAVALAQEAASRASPGQTTQRDPTLGGDLVATLGAAAMGVYLSLGASVRSWLPLWLYVFPVTLASGILSGIASLILEGTTVRGLGPAALMGLFGDARRFGLVFGSAVTSGLLGHTMANLSLTYISPLIVSVLLLFEPLIGSLLGFIVGVQAAPSLVTWLAGIPLMLAAGLVSLGNREGDLYKKMETLCSRRGGVGSDKVVDDSSTPI